MSWIFKKGYINAAIADEWLESNTIGIVLVRAGLPANAVVEKPSRASPLLRGEVAR